jgi:hypothetical protein
MANSIAYVLSLNTYPDAFQANLIGAKQGTQIVYATTDTLSSSNILYTDSRLTQPFYGDPTAWYGVQLLDDDAVKYALLIGANGAITTNPGTTTTTVAPATTTTIAPSTTTTTQNVANLYNAGYSVDGITAVCNETGPFTLPLTVDPDACTNGGIVLNSGTYSDYGITNGSTIYINLKNGNVIQVQVFGSNTMSMGCTSCG